MHPPPTLPSGNALEELVEVILAEGLEPALEPLVVEHEALDDDVAKHLDRSDAELARLEAVDAVAHRDDRVEVEVAGRVDLAVRGSCFQIGNNCGLLKLARLERCS
jgi:hypothetical protein